MAPGAPLSVAEKAKLEAALVHFWTAIEHFTSVIEGLLITAAALDEAISTGHVSADVWDVLSAAVRAQEGGCRTAPHIH